MASENVHKRQRFSALRIALIGILVLLVVLLAAGAWLIGTESGARAAFTMLPRLTGDTVQAEGIRGKLASSLHIDQLTLKTADQRIEMKDVNLQWEPAELLQRRLHLRRLHIGQLSVVQAIKEEDPPPELPENISLPFALQADTVRIDNGVIRRGPAELARIGGAAFNLAFDGEQYRLGLDRLALRTGEAADAVSGELSGQATLSVNKPYPLSGQFNAAANLTVQERMLRPSGRIGLDGSLEQLAATIDLAVQQSKIDGKATLHPFSEQPLGSANLQVSMLDLSSFNPDLPHTQFNLTLTSSESGAGRLSLTNRDAGMYNEGKVPLTELTLAFRQEDGGFIFDKIHSALGSATQPAGNLNGSGRYIDGALTLALRTAELDLQRLDQRFPATRLSGKIGIDRTENVQEFSVALTEPMKKNPLSIVASASVSDERVTVDEATLQVGSGRANLSGYIGLTEQQAFAAEGQVSKFRLQDLGDFPQLPRMTLNGNFEINGVRTPELAGDLTFHITDSLVAGHPLRGDGRAQLRGERINVPNLLLVAGANRLTMQGELSERSSNLAFTLQAPELGQLGEDFGGSIVANGRARGTAARPRIDAEWTADNVRLPNRIRIAQSQGKADIDIDRSKPFSIHAASVEASARGLKMEDRELASLTARIQFAPEPTAPLSLTLQAKELTLGGLRADSLAVTAEGTTARHALDARLIEPGQNWTLEASGGLHDLAKAPTWKGSIDQLEASGRLAAKLEAPAPLTVSQQRLALDRFRLNSDIATVVVDRFVRNSQNIVTSGRIDQLALKEVLKFADPTPALTTDLILDGEWDVTIADTINGTVALRRTDGDILIRSGTPVALGLSMLQANITADKGRVDLNLDARGEKLGRIDISANTRLAAGVDKFSIPPDAPLSGRARIVVPTIAWVGPVVSPTLTTEGRVQSEFSVGGTLSDPKLDGSISGDELRIYSADLGIDLRQGTLDSEFHESELLLKSLRFQSAQGLLQVTGPIDFGGGKPNARLTLSAERFRILNQSDRRLTISGQSQIALNDGRASVEGEFLVNSGYFNIGRAGTPQLSDDVVIVGQSEESKERITPALNILVRLGDGVELEGRGIDAVLVGEVRLQNASGEPLQAYGTLRIAKGTFAAYGRELAIERGNFRFTGPIDNPALNILAMRRGQEVEAGVSVQGTVLAPRITLVSEPSVPEAEKLSWLVLGRGLSEVGEGELGSLQSAAGALLQQGAAAGVQSQIANAFGLDTVSLSRSDDNLEQRIITLGKQISSRLYVSYQQGLETANRAVLLRYTLSPRLTVEMQAGARSALSLFYNLTFD